MKIKDHVIGEGVFIIAEIACAHDGSLEKMARLIDAAAAARADAVQFIVFSTDATTAPYHPAYTKGKTLEFSEQQWREIIMYARQKNIIVSAAVQDMNSAMLMRELNVDMLKIHSPDLSNPDLIRYAAGAGKPLMMTVGASTIDEIEEAVNTAQTAGNTEIILMYGFQNYPTRVERVNLRLLQTLRTRFNCVIGYADHTDGDSPLTVILPIMSTQLGAVVLEKHITLARADKGTDHESALNPDEFLRFVQSMRDTEKALGDGVRHPFTDEELRYRELVKKSIVAARDINSGEIIHPTDLMFLRAGKGLPPNDTVFLHGRSLRRDVRRFDILLREDVL